MKFSSWLRRLFRHRYRPLSGGRRSPGRRQISRRPKLEFLESRLAPATYAWNSPDFDGNWNDPTRWMLLVGPPNADGFPNAPGDIADLTGNRINSDRTIFIPNGVQITVGSILIDDDNSYNIASVGTGNLVLDSLSGDAVLQVTNAAGNGAHRLFTDVLLQDNLTISNSSTGTFRISGALSEPAGQQRFVEKRGAGTVRLDGVQANTFTGITTVFAGTLELAKPANLLAIGGHLDTFGTVRTINSNQIPDSALVVVRPTGSLDLNNQSETIDSIRITTGTVTIGTGTLTVSSVLMNAGSISSVGAGRLVLGGNVATTAAATPAQIEGIIDLGSATRFFTVADGDASPDLLLNATIQGDVDVGLIKQGAGSLRLSGDMSNTYTGTTTVNAGTVELAKTDDAVAIPAALVIGDGSGIDQVTLINSDQIGNTVAVQVNSSGVLNLNDNSDLIGSMTVNGGAVNIGAADLSVSGAVTMTGGQITTTTGDLVLGAGLTTLAAGVSATVGNIDLNGATQTFDVANGTAVDDLIVSGVLSNGGVNKTGEGRLVYSGSAANTYTGGTTVSAGELALRKDANVVAVRGSLIVGDGTGLDNVEVEADGQTDPATAVTITTSGRFRLSGGSATIGALTISGADARGVVLGNGRTLTLAGNVTVPATPATDSPALIEGAGTLNLGGATRTFDVADAFNSPDPTDNGDLRVSVLVTNGGILKTGAGRMVLNADNTYTGPTTINAGELIVRGQQTASLVTVNSGGTLGGDGRVGVVTANGGTVAPGFVQDLGILSTGDVTFTDGTLEIEIRGTSPGTQYDVLTVSGTVTITNSTLSLLYNASTPVGSLFFILSNDGADPINGTFNGLPEGTIIVAPNGQRLRITYAGGDGNDVVLIRVNSAPNLTAPLDQTADEGTPTAFNLGTFTDPDPDAPWTVSVNWGDGTPTETFDVNTPGALSRVHAYADNVGSPFVVTVTVTDFNRAISNTITFQVTVNNVAPVYTAPDNQGPVAEGSFNVFNLGSFTDPGADAPWTVTVDWGDGTATETFTVTMPGALSRAHTYADNVGSPFTVTVFVTDKDGAASNTGTFQVTVIDVVPVLMAPANQTANEGTLTNFNLGSFTDPGADAPWTVTVNWGDGTATETFTVTMPGALSRAHTYADNVGSPFTVTVFVTDKDGVVSNTITFQVTVNNVAPVYTPPPNQGPVNEGSLTTFDLGSFTDPGADAPWTVTVDWGDGTATETFTVTMPGALSRAHTYADNVGSPFTVTVFVTDKDGAVSNTGTFQVTVNNVAPVYTAPPDQGPVDEGSATTFDLGSFTDPGADAPWTVTVNWGDGTATETFTVTTPSALSRAHTYADNVGSPFTVTVFVTDKDGARSNTGTFQVTVNDVAPVLTAPADQGPFNEGSSNVFNLGSFTDPGADAPWTVTVNWGDGVIETFTVNTPGGLSRAHTYVDNRPMDAPYTVTVFVTDKDGVVSNTITFLANIVNVPPTVTAPPDQGPFNEGTLNEINLGSFADPGPDAPYTVRVDWGDGVVETFVVNSTGPLSRSHIYFDNLGSPFTVAVTVTDKDGGVSNTATFQVTVVENITPVLTAPPDQGPIPEGTPTELNLGSFIDSGSDAPWTVTVDWGDATAVETFPINGQGPIFRFHNYRDDVGSPFTVTVFVTDKDGAASNTITFRVTVNNVAPVYTAPADQGPFNEGDLVNFRLGSFTDPGADAPWTVTVDWGDGTPVETFTVNTPSDLVRGHIYRDDVGSPFTVTVTVTDKDGASSAGTFRVVINDVPPVLTPPANQTVNEGTTTLFQLGSFTDPGLDDAPFTVTVNWGDGTPLETFTVNVPGTLARVHTYVDNIGSPFTVTVTVTDRNNVTSAPATFQVTVNDVPPVLTAPINQATTEGAAALFSLGSFTDPGADAPWTISINWGDGTALETFTVDSPGALSRTHTYADDVGSPFTVQVTVTDKDGVVSNIGTFQVTVANVTPVVASPGNQGPLDEGTMGLFNLGSFADPGADAPWTVTIDWGDNTPTETFTVINPGDLPARPHTYADSGNYRVLVTVTDKDGATGSASFTVQVNNVAPVVANPTLDRTTINEGETVTLTGSFFDPGQEVFFIEINWGDGNFDQLRLTGQGTLAIGPLTHLYRDNQANNAPFTITITVTDKDGGAGVNDTGRVTVLNVNPIGTLVRTPGTTVPPTEVVTVSEGGQAFVTILNATDPGPADLLAGFRYAYDFDNDGTFEIGDGTFAGSSLSSSEQIPAAFLDDGPRDLTVRVRIIDKDGGSSDQLARFRIVNVAPTATDFRNNGPVNEGSTATVTFVDPTDPSTADRNAGLRFSYDFNDDGIFEIVNSNLPTATVPREFLQDGPATRTVRGRITDKDGGFTEFRTSIAVANVAPSNVVLTLDRLSVNESDPNLPTDPDNTLTLTVTFNDPGVLDSFPVSINWGDGSSTELVVAPSMRQGNQPGDPIRFTATHRYLNGTVTNTITVNVRDKDGGQADLATTQIRVNDVAPQILSLTATYPAGQVQGNFPFLLAGQSLRLTVTFTDPGRDDRYIARIEWGDGSVEEVPLVNARTGNTTFNIEHVFTEASCTNPPGTVLPKIDLGFPIRVTLQDTNPVDAGSTDTAELRGNDSINVRSRPELVASDPGSILSSTVNGVTTIVNQVIATFTDSGAGISAARFRAVINWGDGTSSVFDLSQGVPPSITVPGGDGRPVQVPEVYVQRLDEAGNIIPVEQDTIEEQRRREALRRDGDPGNDVPLFSNRYRILGSHVYSVTATFRITVTVQETLFCVPPGFIPFADSSALSFGASAGNSAQDFLGRLFLSAIRLEVRKPVEPNVFSTIIVPSTANDKFSLNTADPVIREQQKRLTVQQVQASREYLTRLVRGLYCEVLDREILRFDPANPAAQPTFIDPAAQTWVQFLAQLGSVEQLRAIMYGSDEFRVQLDNAAKGLGTPFYQALVDAVRTTVPPGQALSSEELYIRVLYLRLLGRGATQQEVTSWLGMFALGMDRTQMALAFSNSDEGRLFALGKLYEDYLGRNPLLGTNPDGSPRLRIAEFLAASEEQRNNPQIFDPGINAFFRQLKSGATLNQIAFQIALSPEFEDLTRRG